MKARSLIEIALRIGFALLPLVLLLLPASFFDEGPTVCPSQLLLQVECPGCGLTRATQHFLHLDWKVAWDYNPLVLFTTPFLAWLWLRNLRTLWAALKIQNAHQQPS